MLMLKSEQGGRCSGGAHSFRGLLLVVLAPYLEVIQILSFFRYLISRPLVTPDTSNSGGSGLTRGLIRAYLSGRQSLRPTLSHD